MRIYDIVHCSTVDWPGKVSMIIYAAGCDLDCPYCSNWRMKKLVSMKLMSPEELETEIVRARPFHTAVIMSGGEALLQGIMPLVDVAHAAHKSDSLFGLTTNGNHPAELKALLDLGQVDAVFIDVKAPDQNYSYAIGGNDGSAIAKRVHQSIRQACAAKAYGRCKYVEVRTTVFDGMNSRESDHKGIVSRMHKNVDKIFLQQGRPELGEPYRCESLKWTTPTREKLEQLCRIYREKGFDAEVR